MPFEPQPTLKGDLIELRPLRPEDFDALYAVACDPLIWEQHPDNNRHERDVFRKFVDDALASGGAFVATDAATARIIGSTRYHGYDAAKREVEIGWTFLARAYWGGRFNTEMKRLMLQHAFQFVDRVIFIVGVTNIRSQKAMLKIGGVLTDRREVRPLNGQPSENVVFEITNPARLERPAVP